jgi:hypothetical protein
MPPGLPSIGMIGIAQRLARTRRNVGPKMSQIPANA